MKCPKCGYLGFETGDRCKNCRYDFSLLTSRPGTEEPHAGLPLRQPPQEIPLPLFAPAFGAGDEPLVKLPAAPRPPLAVRRTPEVPRLRAVPAAESKTAPAPVLAFAEPERGSSPTAPVVPNGEASAAPHRLAAAAVDHLMLAAVDAIVIYFTLRMAALPVGEWQLLPPVPILAFLVLVKLAYFGAFTAVGGQTIGKMAAGVRVVTDDGGAVDGGRALRRTLAAAVSFLTFGLGFVPALVGAERRAFHDRVARTRVISVRQVPRA